MLGANVNLGEGECCPMIVIVIRISLGTPTLYVCRYSRWHGAQNETGERTGACFNHPTAKQAIVRLAILTRRHDSLPYDSQHAINSANFLESKKYIIILFNISNKVALSRAKGGIGITI